MTDEAYEFLVLVEAEADARTATALADRIFVERGPDWIDGNFEYLRKWSGFISDMWFSCWKDFKQIEKKYIDKGYKRPRYLGYSRNGAGKTDSATARRAILLAQEIKKTRLVRALILIRDLDSQSERREGLEQARNSVNREILEIIIGTSDPNREAWVLNGFIPLNEREEKLLEKIRSEICLDPCLKAESLRSTEPNDPRNVKKVLSRLTNGEYDREEKCWSETNLDVLVNRGEKTGLRDYLNEVETRLLPILGDGA